MKLWVMPCRATQDGWVIVESSDKTWSTEGENGKPLQHFAARTPWIVWKGKNIWCWKMSLSGKKVSNMLLGKSRAQLLIAPERMKQLGQSRNDAQLWMCLVVKVWCCKEQYSIGWANSEREWGTEKPGMLQSLGSQRVGHDLVTEHHHQQKQKASVSSNVWWR